MITSLDGLENTGNTAREALRPNDIVARGSGALSAEIDGEVVALDVTNGVCYGLDPIGSRIWTLIETPMALDDLCAALTAEYQVDATTCFRDLTDLVADLHAAGLIIITTGSASGAD